MYIRRTVYRIRGEAISLAYVECLADAHPELLPDMPPPPPATPEPKADPQPRWTELNVRRLMGRDAKQAARVADRIKYEATMRRVLREGF